MHSMTFRATGKAALIMSPSRPKAALDPDTLVGIDAINANAVGFKYMEAPLTKEQLAELI